jgi:carbamoyltransferase
MLILSHYAGHDPAVCILRDGEVLLNLEKERVSRIRHDIGMNSEFIEKCLDWAGISTDEIDVLATMLGDHTEVEGPCEALFQGDLDLGYRFDRKFGTRRIPEIRIHHHLAHAASAFFTSPFQDAVLMTWDGGGDDANTSIGLARDGRIARWKPTTNANIASWFRFVGLKNFGMPVTSRSDLGSQAGKVMALAAYGSPDEKIINRLRSEISLFPFTGAFNAGENLSDIQSDRAQNLAAALQTVAEEYLELLFERAYLWGDGVENLCFAGGVALNCVANTKAFNHCGFSNLYVPPCSNDGGLALGQALFVHHQTYRMPRTPKHFNSYNGPIHDDDAVNRAIANADLSKKKVLVRPVDQDRLVELLIAGEVVAMYRGASETGPRALGHRSIISRPDFEATRDFLNHEVKQREWYRPFAPIVLADHCDTLFEPEFPQSPYMATTAVIRPEWRQRLGAVCHVDGTTRPQVLQPNHEPWLFELISKFHRATGIPAIVNTSFNRREPIVETPDEAINTFLEMPLKFLCINDLILEKTATVPS